MKDMERSESDISKVVDFCPNVQEFSTEFGSVYRKSADGRFVRNKFDGSVSPAQEFTLFIDERKAGPDFEMLTNPLIKRNMTCVIMQPKRSPDGDIIRDDDGELLDVVTERDQIYDPEDVNIIVIQVSEDGDYILGDPIPATLVPYIGADVFEVGGFVSDGELFEKTANNIHFGHKVKSIK